MPKRFPLIELLVAIVIIALLSFPGEKKTGKEKPGLDAISMITESECISRIIGSRITSAGTVFTTVRAP